MRFSEFTGAEHGHLLSQYAKIHWRVFRRLVSTSSHDVDIHGRRYGLGWLLVVQIQQKAGIALRPLPTVLVGSLAFAQDGLVETKADWWAIPRKRPSFFGKLIPNEIIKIGTLFNP